MIPTGWEQRAELAGGEIFQGAKTAVEFGGRQAALAEERAQKMPGRTVALARIAFDAAGNQVAVGIASEAHAWHDVVEALDVSGSAAEAVEAGAAFAIVNGFAERPALQEIGGFEGGGGLFRGPGAEARGKRVGSGDWRRNENRNSPRKDLTQRAQGSEHRGHREEGKKDSSSNNRSMAQSSRCYARRFPSMASRRSLLILV